MEIFGDGLSGNCLKVKWTADRLGLTYRWTEVSVVDAETRKPPFLAINPWGQVPAVRFDDGRVLTQSNAIIFHLAEGSDLVPTDSFDRARMLEWMFWEQYSHEPYIAVARYQMRYLGKPREEVEPRLFERGGAALDRLEAALAGRDFLVGERLSLADIALVAYTRWAPEGGFDLGPHANLRRWIGRIEGELNLSQ